MGMLNSWWFSSDDHQPNHKESTVTMTTDSRRIARVSCPLLAAVLTLAVANVITAEEPAKPKAEEKAKPRPSFTIGKETTYITEPLTEEGYPDYAAAINGFVTRAIQIFGPSVARSGSQADGGAA